MFWNTGGSKEGREGGCRIGGGKRGGTVCLIACMCVCMHAHSCGVDYAFSAKYFARAYTYVYVHVLVLSAKCFARAYTYVYVHVLVLWIIRLHPSALNAIFTTRHSIFTTSALNALTHMYTYMHKYMRTYILYVCVCVRVNVCA